MKNLKNYLKNGMLVALCAIAIPLNLFPMFTKKSAEERDASLRRLQRMNQYFLHETDDPNKGIWVDKEFIKANCGALKNMIADFGSAQEVKIPIFGYPVATIKLGFGVLANKIDASNLSSEELINVANLFNFLGVPVDKMKIVLDKILADFNNIPDEQLKKLNPDVQKVLMTDPSINYLKDCINKKYAHERKQILEGHQRIVFTVAVSADGKKMVSGSGGITNNLIVWDMTDPHSITKQVLAGYPSSVNAVAISPDGTKIVIGGNAAQNYLMLWDITDPNNIVRQELVGHPSSVNAVAFSPDGNTVVSGSYGNQNSLLVWDVHDINNITYQALAGNINNVYSVAFSHDGKRMVSGSGVFSTVWDMSNLNNITQQTSVTLSGEVYAVAFSPDDKYIVSGCGGTKNNLAVWDVSDAQNIIPQFLVGHQSSVSVAIFSHDGKRIASGCGGFENNFILWDMSNPHNITHQQIGQGLDSVRAVAFTSDDKKVISGSNGIKNNLIVWTLLTDQEESSLKQFNNCTADQIRFIYRLCQKSLTGKAIVLDSEEQTIFTMLSQDVQKFLTDLLLSRG